MLASELDQFINKLNEFKLVTDYGCWLWTGPILDNGYGRIYVKGQQYLVHRLSAHVYLNLDLNNKYQQANHKSECRHRRCFNPEHLYVGNQFDNLFDSVKAKTHVEARKTHCPLGHEYTKDNTYITNSGARRCRKCQKEQNKRSILKRREKNASK